MSNKKTKKLAAVVTALILAVVMLAGCSPDDLGYWNLCIEKLNVKSGAITGDFTFEINPEVIGMYNAETVKVKMDFSGNFIKSADDIYLDCKIKYGVNDTKMPNELNIIMADDALYMPAKDLIDLITIGLKLEGEFSDKMVANFKAALQKELSGKDYLLLTDCHGILNKFGIIGMSINGLSNKSAETSSIMKDSFTKMLSGLDSGMIKKATEGYTFEITPDNTLEFADRLVVHISKNKKTIFNETVKLLKALGKLYSEDETTQMIIEEALDWVENYEQEFYDAIDFITESYGDLSDYDKDYFKLMLKGSYLKHTISKSGGAYTDNFDCLINYEGEKLLSFKGKSKVTPQAVIKKEIDAKNAIGMGALEELLDKITKKVNPVQEMTITWDNGSDYVWMSIEFISGYDWDSADSNIENGTMYLPMRQICEWFGEEVFWDKKERKAYVIRGEDKIEMTGKIVNDRTLVKIRDFEKLGYTVDYEYDKAWKEHMVTIKR